MKYCLTARQSDEYLKKADEIKFEYRDRQGIPDFAEKYPNAQLVVEVPQGVQIEMDELKNLYYLSKEKMILCLPDITIPEIIEMKRIGMPFYWGYAITNACDLRAVKDIGVCSVRIGAPLFFQMDIVKNYNIPVRCMANLAIDRYFMNKSGATGTWIRPEDVELYEGIIDVIDFDFENLSQERALYRIYAERHEWPGDIDMIIKNVHNKAVNRMLPRVFTEKRLNCGQRCMNTEDGRNCHLCQRYLQLAVPEYVNGVVVPQDVD